MGCTNLNYALLIGAGGSYGKQRIYNNLIFVLGIYFTIKNIIVWVKNNWTAGDIKAQYGKQYEFIIYANKGRREINGKRLSDVWEFDRVVGKKQLHQNEKPLGLIEQIIEKSSSENDIILDAFLGSGTTAVAAKKLGRICVGIEIVENYLNMTKEKLITLEV